MFTLNYIQNKIDTLTTIKAGLTSNSSDFEGSDLTPAKVQTKIDELELDKKKVINTETLLHQNRIDARAASVEANDFINIIVVKIKGVYAENTKKLADFGIDAHNSISNQQRTAPSKGKVVSIKQDSDNEGLIVKGEPLTDVDIYEWEKGEGPAGEVNVIPVFKHLVTSHKSKILDSDVHAGIRYFYRYRGNNAAGNGSWSEPSSTIF